jgi:hypothetical protein
MLETIKQNASELVSSSVGVMHYHLQAAQADISPFVSIGIAVIAGTCTHLVKIFINCIAKKIRG